MFNVRTVSTMRREDFDRVHKTVSEWEEIANKKMELACSEEELRVWDDYSMIASTINPSGYNTLRKKERRMFIVEGRALEALALVERKESGIKLNTILGNPENPKSGAGRALMQHIFQECLNAKMDGMVVDSVPLAVSFYSKLGFEEVGAFCPKKGCSMRITAKKMEEILTKK